MNLFKNLWTRILALFGIKTQTTETQYNSNQLYENSYEDIRRINFNAIFSNKLSNYICNESTISIDNVDRRTELLNGTIEYFDKNKKKIVNRILGTGGVVLVPYVYNKQMLYNVIPQYRLSINEKQGDKIVNATILADVKTETTNFTTKSYYRWQNEEVRGNSLYITQKYTDENGTTIDKPNVFNNIDDETYIPNMDRCLFSYFKSSVDNRKSTNDYGVPITYGCGGTIAEIYECLEQIRDEFKLKQTFVGVDSTLFKTDEKGRPQLPESKLYKTFRADGDDFWEIFDPAIRDSSYYARLQELFERLEKEVGTSKGILSTPQTSNATATEIRKGIYDTYTIVGDMRKQIEQGLNDFLYVCNILANYYGLTPASLDENVLNFDWSYELLENTEESFSQLMQGYSKGVISDVELRQFIMPSETQDEAEEKLLEIKENQPKISDILNINEE